MMTADELRAFLRERNVNFKEQPIQHAVQFKCEGGEIFSAFETGKISIQGKQKSPLAIDVRALESGTARAPVVAAPRAEPAVGAATSSVAEAPIFIVYGHDVASRDSLELVLRRMGLHPIILQNVPAAGDTLIEKLERYLGEHANVGFACVLLTPDDQGYKAGFPEEVKYRARQNVVLELGMVLARLGRRRVAILHKESVELPSDIAGLLYIPFGERVDEVRTRLFRELQQVGYKPSLDALG